MMRYMEHNVRLTGALDPRSAWSAERCTIAKAIEVVSTRSAVLLLREAFYGAARFDEFVARTGRRGGSGRRGRLDRRGGFTGELAEHGLGRGRISAERCRNDLLRGRIDAVDEPVRQFDVLGLFLGRVERLLYIEVGHDAQQRRADVDAVAACEIQQAVEMGKVREPGHDATLYTHRQWPDIRAMPLTGR